MSWTLSAVGRDAEDAKAKLRAMAEQQGSDCPETVLNLADVAVVLLPASAVEGYDAVAVSTYGHLHGADEHGTSNINLSVQHVNADGLGKAA